MNVFLSKMGNIVHQKLTNANNTALFAHLSFFTLIYKIWENHEILYLYITYAYQMNN